MRAMGIPKMKDLAQHYQRPDWVRRINAMGDSVAGAARLISLDADGSLRRIDVTAFLEPIQFQAAPSWYQQYTGHPLSDEVMVQRAIRAIAGATLTATATNSAVRRVLATDLVLEGTAR